MDKAKFKEYFKKLVRRGKNVNDICKILQISEAELVAILDKLRKQGDNYVLHKNSIIEKKRPDIENRAYRIASNKDHLRLLLAGDFHTCNKSSNIDRIREIYDIAEDTNTDYALNCGDLVEGYTTKYSNFLDEVFISTYGGQKDYVVEKYPRFSGITLAVSGNHDDWWFRHTNKEILKDVSKERDDFKYLGCNSARIIIGDLKINLVHGDIIPSTKEDFKLKQYISHMGECPHIIHYGHAHLFDYAKFCNIHCYRTPSMMRSTSYSHNGENGAYFVDVYMDDNGKVKEIIKTKKIYK